MRVDRIIPVLVVVLVIGAGAMTVLAGSPPAQTAPSRPTDVNGITVELEEVLAGFEQPIHVTNAGDGTDRIFVVERQGRILVAVDGEVQPEPFLDIRELVGDWFIEQGLFSIAFHPDFSENGYFYVYYTATPDGGDESRAGDNTIARYEVSPDNPNRADHDSQHILLALPDREVNHNGGNLVFGPDGYLYAGTGDEGGQGARWNNSQDPQSYFGKILRLDVDGGGPYAIPPDNPFAGNDDYLPEIWMMGLRNPWRFSFDAESDTLFIGDVGDLIFEELNRVPAGKSGLNFGWPIVEGKSCYPAEEPCDDSGLTLPIIDYRHDEGGGCSITSGFVYRGQDAPFMQGTFVFGDWCSGLVWMLTEDDGEWNKVQIGQFPISISSFGQDEQGELYLTDMINGKIQRLHFIQDESIVLEHDAFSAIWARTDGPVSAGLVDRTWMWGPEPFTPVRMESYAEAPDGQRQVQYFDKSRMEINDPDLDPGSSWYVTNGLLVSEMMTGAMQTGDAGIEWRVAAEINVAGDTGDTGDPDGVTYATLAGLMDAEPNPDGLITATLSADGTIGDDGRTVDYGITAGPLVEATSHRVAAVFWEFMTLVGLVHNGEETVSAPLFENPFYATGLPITEAYWTTVEVDGNERLVLLQAFERRVLTYTPDNDPGWRVEAGNVGRHYFEWRYGDLP